MSGEKKKLNRAQRYTEGMLDAVEELTALVRSKGLSVLPPRAVEVIGSRPVTKATLIEASVRALLDEATGRAGSMRQETGALDEEAPEARGEDTSP